MLRLLAERTGPLGLVEIAQSLGLAKGTAHGILRTLHGVGFVEQDSGTGKYQLGTALLDLGRGRLDGNELRARALNWADALAARCGEAVYVGTCIRSQVLLVHHVFRPDGSPQTLAVGTTLPAHACALGKVLLAFDAVAAERLLQQQPQPYTRFTVTDQRRLLQQLAQVRASGWGAEIEELRVGEAAVAAPIRAFGGLVVGAIAVSGPVERLCDRSRRPQPDHVSRVREAAHAVSRELGAARW